MQLKKFILLPVMMFITIIAGAVEELPKHLMAISSKPGLLLLKKRANETTVKLLSHFTTQETQTYCGVASAVMVLNSMDIVPPVDPAYSPYSYFTQDVFFNEQVSNILPSEEVKKTGIGLAQLAAMISTYGVKAKPVFASDIDMAKMRHQIRHTLAQGKFIIANFHRTGIGQPGGGHHSPIAAYDEKTDRFLILDVARYKYPSFWIKTEDLWAGINTLDGEVSRGFIVIE